MPIIPPDFGTNSSYYSQNFDNIQELLQRIYDNNSNIIVAKDVRDPLWTLWNKISGLSASLGSASISYTLGTPSTISVGGITEGSTFSNATLSELFDQMLLPYVAPIVNNFTPSVVEKQFGDTGPINLSYSINVGSLALDDENWNSGYDIQFESPNPASSIPKKPVTGNDPETGTTNNFSLTYSTATVSVVSYAVATMSFKESGGLTFTVSTSIAQKHKRYYGQISIPIGFTPSNPASVAAVSAYLTDTRIKGLSYSELSTNVNFSQAVDFDSSGQYFVFAAPTIFGFNYPIGFYVDNIFNQNYTKIRSNSNLSNEFGFVAPYDVFIINDEFIDPALISTVPLPQGYISSFNSVIPSVIIGDQGPQGATGPQGLSSDIIDLDEIAFGTGTGLTSSIIFTIDPTDINLNFGSSNVISNSSFNSSVIGGYCNTITCGSENSSIMGGCCNAVACDSTYSSIIGGQSNKLNNLSYNSSVIGGCRNVIGTQSCNSVIIGGNNLTLLNQCDTALTQHLWIAGSVSPNNGSDFGITQVVYIPSSSGATFSIVNGIITNVIV